MQTVSELFMDLVQIDSIPGEEDKMVEKVCDFLQNACNLEPSVDAHKNVFIQTEGSGEPFFFCTLIRENASNGSKNRTHLDKN